MSRHIAAIAAIDKRLDEWNEQYESASGTDEETRVSVEAINDIIEIVDASKKKEKRLWEWLLDAATE